jgi:catechol 2,3-dioxygenase-like lactoylglutathione lyase family enzyme
MLLPAEIMGIDHVQVAAPKGCEREARRFYGKVLGLEEIKKPRKLQEKGGVWFRCGDAQLHVGVEEGFQPAHKAHPAIAVASVYAVADRLRRAGVQILDEITEIAGRRRFFVEDPVGNRIEFTEPGDTEAHRFD